jgi:hypothetical protein
MRLPVVEGPGKVLVEGVRNRPLGRRRRWLPPRRRSSSRRRLSCR